ncbi:hypothetical protein D3C78_1648790 [compost metagenome]
MSMHFASCWRAEANGDVWTGSVVIIVCTSLPMACLTGKAAGAKRKGVRRSGGQGLTSLWHCAVVRSIDLLVEKLE